MGSVRIDNVIGRRRTLIAIRTLWGKTGFEFTCGGSGLREFREVLRNFPEVPYFTIILFSGTCSCQNIVFLDASANEGRK
jgi:hypothetical protein